MDPDPTPMTCYLYAGQISIIVEQAGNDLLCAQLRHVGPQRHKLPNVWQLQQQARQGEGQK